MAYIVFDKYRNAWGPFTSAGEASKWATKKWPNQHEVDPSEGGTGWHVAVLRPPT